MRRFTLHGSVGPGLSSAVGMLEGCALSVLGMSLWIFAGMASARPLSLNASFRVYVDNLCLVLSFVAWPCIPARPTVGPPWLPIRGPAPTWLPREIDVF